MIWYPFLGWGIFWVALIAAIVLYAISRKFYTIFYMISVALYIFTAGFAINVFDLDKIWVLLILIFSAVVFIVIGYYLSRVYIAEKRR